MIAADTHVHLYACYDLAQAFRRALDQLRVLGGADATRAILLTERGSEHFFPRLRDGELAVDGFDVRAADANALRVVDAAGETLWVFAGRQIVTAERLEVLALTTDAGFEDGRSIAEALEAVEQSGAVPLLPWGFGKWLFARGKVVARVLEQAEPGRLLVGDTKLRPTVWATPRLLRTALRRGLTLLAGTDPLPAPGEEALIGSYASLIDADLDEAAPTASLRRTLTMPRLAAKTAGARNRLLASLRRIRRAKGTGSGASGT